MFKRGQWVIVKNLSPAGDHIAVVVVPGPGVERNMGTPVREIPAGHSLVHLVKPDGTTVMLPDEKSLKFVAAALVIPNEQITAATPEQIPESRR